MSASATDHVSGRLQSLSIQQQQVVTSTPADSDSVADAEAMSLTRWRLPLATVYHLASNWARHCSEGGPISLGYETRVQLAALGQQVRLGPCRSAPRPPVGTLDLLGRARRDAWLALGYRSRGDCQLAYIDTVIAADDTGAFAAYLTAARSQLEEQEQRQEPQEEYSGDSQEQQEQQATARQIQDALNRQTYSQFREYAERQYPGQCERQALLICQLQQQHYRQYMQQLYQRQQHEQLQQPQLQSDRGSSDATDSGPQQSPAAAGEGEVLGQDVSGVVPGVDGQVLGEESLPARSVEADEAVLDAAPAPLLLQPAQLWTRDNIADFKAAVLAENSAAAAAAGGNSVVRVAHGETVSVQVPTLSDGARLHWEFATDSYDLGFGVMFEWRACADDRVTIQVSESDDDDDDEDDDDAGVAADDGQGGYDEEGAVRASKSADKPPTSCLIPVYRRDCHKFVYAGSHAYPASEGVYVLKFDNSYSLWRSKTLYFRVFYSR